MTFKKKMNISDSVDILQPYTKKLSFSETLDSEQYPMEHSLYYFQPVV